MSRSPRGTWQVAAACTVIALAVSGVAVVASIESRGWSPTTLVRMGTTEPMARLASEASPDFRFVSPAAHYDGVYFYTIARDPFAWGEPHTLIDNAAYRYGHPGYGWLAWLLSLGMAGAVPAALLLVSLASVAIAAYAASLIARDHGWSPWGGLVVAFNPGIVYSVTADTSEPLGIALLALALLAWTRHRRTAATVAIAAACLTKEPFVLVPVGLALWEAIEAARGRRSPDLVRRLALLAVGPACLAAWYVYLRLAFGHFPFSEAHGLTTLPLEGWIDAFRDAAVFATGDFNASQIGSVSVPLLAVCGVLLLLGLVVSLQARTPIDPVYLLFALVALSLSWLGVLYPKDLFRELVVPLSLVPAVLAGALWSRPPPR
jgi:hypothetical protein